jgi:uncharacterized repeat protein (TIGR01451 family)
MHVPLKSRASRLFVLAGVPVLLTALLLFSMREWPAAQAVTGTVTVCTIGGDFATIQAAVDAAEPDTIINICPGTYQESVNLSEMASIGNITLQKDPAIAGDVLINPNVGVGIWITPNLPFFGNITLKNIKVLADDTGIDLGTYTFPPRFVLGNVIFSNVDASQNNGFGSYIRATGVVTIEQSQFISNTYTGLRILADLNYLLGAAVPSEPPRVYINGAVANRNGEDGIMVESSGKIEVYNTEANENGDPENIGSYGSGIFIEQRLMCAGAEIANGGEPPLVHVQETTTNDNHNGFGTYIANLYNVTVIDLETIGNPLDGLSVEPSDNGCLDAIGMPTITVTDSYAEDNGWGAELTVNSLDAIETQEHTYREFGGFRLVSYGNIFVNSSADGLANDQATEAFENHGFGFCLQADGETEVTDTWAVGNHGDGFTYSYGEICLLPGFRDKAESADTSTVVQEQNVDIAVPALLQESLVFSNSSAIENGATGFDVIDSSVVVTMVNISALRNITGVSFYDEPSQVFDTTAFINSQQTGDIAGPTLIHDSLIQSNTNFGIYYEQGVYDYIPAGSTEIQGVGSITSTNDVHSSIICQNGEGLGAFQELLQLLGSGSVGTQDVVPPDQLLYVDAIGNYWGDLNGPDAPLVPPGNTNPAGDSIIVVSVNPTIFANQSVVDYVPWIDTIIRSATPNPTLVGIPVNVAYQFVGGTNFLENGVGNPNDGPLFTLSTNNGAVNGNAQKFIVNTLIEGSVTPSQPGMMTITLTGPCGLVTTQQVPVLEPAIAIEKTPDLQGVAPGDSALFTITVRNSGTITLTNVNVQDTAAPLCARTVGSIPDLAPGAAHTYSCVRENVTNNFVNTATAFGQSLINSTPAGPIVQATDTAEVVVASISLKKTAFVNGYKEKTGENTFNPSECALASTITVPVNTTVKYCYTVTNTGDYTVTTHSLVDSHIPGSILSNLPYELAPGQSVSTVDLGVKVTSTLSVSTTNVATWTADIAEPVIDLGADAANYHLPTVATAQATVTISPADLDQDGDGIPDNEEGSGDINTNGVPDFLDPAGPTNEPPTDQPTAPTDLFLPSLNNND